MKMIIRILDRYFPEEISDIIFEMILEKFKIVNNKSRFTFYYLEKTKIDIEVSVFCSKKDKLIKKLKNNEKLNIKFRGHPADHTFLFNPENQVYRHNIHFNTNTGCNNINFT